MNLDFHRKAAKALVRARRANDATALRRAEAVLGHRARQRFLLSDAQHVIAVEHGYRSWPELTRAVEQQERVDELVETQLEYQPGQRVRVRVTRRGRRYLVTDDAAAVELAGRPEGWRTVAAGAVAAADLNLARSGAIFVPAVEGGAPLPRLVERVAAASLAAYEEILDLE